MAIYLLPTKPDANKILNIVMPWPEVESVYYYPSFTNPLRLLEDQEQGYTRRIIFLELAALLWEELGR